MPINILYLAAGLNAFDTKKMEYPSCLMEVNGLSLIERIVSNTANISDANYLFALSEEEAKRFYLDSVVRLLVPCASVILIPNQTKGSGCTALFAACKLQQDNELLIISLNELVDLDLSSVVEVFRERNLDGGTLIFRSIHPRYSYVRLNGDGLAVEVAQQKPISSNATVGIFWFKRTKDFIDSVKATIRKDAAVADKFFLAPTFNELILKQMKVGVFNLDINKYHPLKTEKQVQSFEYRSLL